MAAVFFTERGKERLDEQDAETKERITKKLRESRDWPDHFLKPLTGRDDYVLRVGDYRVLIDWRKNTDEGTEDGLRDGGGETETDGGDALYVKSVGHRRNFYDRET
ncbi:hypothetical protein C479_06232 [Halovivax asiaticus JCM 14624]|uniref:Cytotoxic translational repressor of toxin-antitoxin stability system n=1 Tax=Halovivax asiaticus JCM 14624 TaxID=1227490 RepID=M0BMC3_9EURY|nr:hypothetical protein [Halovivax asiaticus]ELZ12021.1 hypothetical protein C479_06232 [Halovivax asiaticus JCM 14624]